MPTTITPETNWRTIWALAIPSGSVFLFFTIVNIINIKIVAPLGGDAVAALTTGQRLYFIFAAVISGISTATLALVARQWGANDSAAAARLLTTASLFAGFLGFVSTLIVWPATPYVVAIFNLTVGATEQSITYMRNFSFFYFPIAAYMVLAAGLRAVGDAKTPMYYALLMAVLTIVMCTILTHGAGPIPALGVGGNAWGSGIANLCVLLVAFGSWFSGRLVLPFLLQADKLKRDLRDICRIGLPTILEQAIMQIGFIGFLWVIANYGTAAYAAYGTGVTLLSVSMVIGLGVSMAGSILVGQHLGAKDIAGARKAGWMAAKQSVIVMTILGAVAAYFAQELSEWLVGEGEVADKTALFLYVLCAAQPFLALDFALGGALRGAGDTRFPLIAAICGLVFFRFGLAMILLHFEADLVWVYATLIADYIMKNILYIKRFNSSRWEKKIAN